MKLFSKITAAVMSLSIACTYAAGAALQSSRNTVSAKTGSCTAEYLDRGITAIKTDGGMLVNWRFLADDSDSTIFKLYRNSELIYTSNENDATCFLDSSGSSSSQYRVDAYADGKIVNSSNCSMISGNSYFDIPLDLPTSSNCTYSPNDCSVGDVDGDGVYELFVKWDPSNSKDNSQKGKTDRVYIDCYKLNGTKLWRIDLGDNIRAGAHYTQFLVADFDLDGKAEMTCKTSDGTVDGEGNVIGDASASYSNSNGYILTGNEYYTLFDGLTGKALDTVDYEYPRGTVKNWGDNYGNRCDRFLGAVCYLDGVKPSAVSVRGYYTRMTAVAYDVINKKLVKRWGFDTGNNSSAAGYGDGNHNCMPADVDSDGKQELVLGATCLDDDGSVLWCLNTGHGDAMHLGDLLPDRTGLELWICHEDSPYGVSLVDASNGKVIFHKDGEKDTGRCCADNVWTGNDGAEFWGLGNDVYDGSGNTLSCRRPAINFLSYWDGDLEREILDGSTDSPATISKMGTDGKLTTLLSTDGYYTCNTTKGTPCLSADIFGDWREELIVRASDSKSVRIYCTPYDTDYRITTLMHDIQYRTQVAGQNTAYNQPPHTSFYLGTEKGVPQREKVTVLSAGEVVIPEIPATLKEGAAYMIKNKNSGLYMEADGSSSGANVQQGTKEDNARKQIWRVISAGSGYYYLYSTLGDGASYCLDVTGGKAANGTNIGIYYKNEKDPQKFCFIDNGDGSYKIKTKSSDNASCVEVINALTESGANIQQYEVNGASCQDWILEETTLPGCIMDTTKEYSFKNVNSGLYMEVTGGSTADNTNIQQWGMDQPSSHNTWTLKQFTADSDLYYVFSKLGDGKTHVLNSTGSGDGANIELLTYNNKTSSMLFKFVKNPDGSYYILPRTGKDSQAVEVADALTSSGANVAQWSVNGHNCQKWEAEMYTVTTTTTTTTTTTSTTTTTTTTTKASESVSTTATTTTIPYTTTITTTTTAPGQPSEVIGDVNQDGVLSSEDIELVQKHILNIKLLLKTQAVTADVSNDGKITAVDLAILKSMLK